MSLVHKTGVIPYVAELNILKMQTDASFNIEEVNTLHINSDMIMNKGAFECYVTGNTTATALTANTPAKVVYGTGKVFNGYSMGFTIDTTTNLGRITYNAPRTRIAHCGMTISWYASTDQIIASFYIKKNGTIIPSSKIKLYLAKDPSKTTYASSAIHTFITFEQNDYIDLWVECDENTNLTVQEANIFGLTLPNYVNWM